MNQRFFACISRFASSRAAIVLLAVWSFAEASVWFILPDFLLVVLCLAAPQKAVRFFVTCVSCSLAGMVSYLFFVQGNPSVAKDLLDHTVFVTPVMFDTVGGWYASEPPVNLLRQSISGIPVKVWAYQAVVLGYNLLTFTIFVGASRLLRMTIVTWVLSRLGVCLENKLAKHFLSFCILYFAVFLFVMFKIAT